MKKLMALLTLAGSLIVVPSIPVAQAQIVDKPNVVIIMTDDQRADTFTPEFMPNTYALATSPGSTIYENAFVPNALCCPSRVSTLTGAYSHTTGVYGNKGDFGGFESFDDDVSIATALNHDYRTLFVGKYMNGYPQNHWNYVPPGWNKWFSISTGAYYNYYVADNGEKSKFYGDGQWKYSGRVLTSKAINYVDDAEEADEPFFLYYAPAAPHGSAPGSQVLNEGTAPTPDPRDVDRFVAHYGDWRPVTYGNKDDISDMPQYLGRAWNKKRKQHTDIFRQRQLESIYSNDREIGRLVASLPDDTLILFMSDNGYMWGEHRWSTKLVPYEESIGIPMFARYPTGYTAAPVDTRLALNIDFVPTILDVAGLALDTPTASSHYKDGDVEVASEGISFLTGTPRTSFPLEHWDIEGPVPGYCGIRTADGYMYARYFDRQYMDNKFVEMYNVFSDPMEQTNLAQDPAYDAIEEELKTATKAACKPVPPTYSWKG